MNISPITTTTVMPKPAIVETVDPTFVSPVPVTPTDPAAPVDPLSPADPLDPTDPAASPAPSTPKGNQKMLERLASGHFNPVADLRHRMKFAEEIAAAKITLPEPPAPPNSRARGL